MFTIDQIKLAHSKVRSGADFPAFVKEIKQLGVRRYTTFVSDGHAEYEGEDGYKVVSEPKYPQQAIAASRNTDEFKSGLKAHQRGATDYLTFCSMAAANGIYKWVVDLERLSCTYFDSASAEVLVEQIPQ